jgi:hypothetical protein
MKTIRLLTLFSTLLTLCWIGLSCNDGTEADEHGVGAQCTTDDDCNEDAPTCLDFKGGYCGIADCEEDADCPDGSRCIAHEDGTNYCFLTCVDKVDCNINRDEENESNCSADVDFIEGTEGDKACVPPSADTTE